MLVCAQWLDPEHELFDPAFALAYQTAQRRKAVRQALLWTVLAIGLFGFRHWIFGTILMLYALFCIMSARSEHKHLQDIRAAIRKRTAGPVNAPAQA